jgi:hypothetical protein
MKQPSNIILNSTNCFDTSLGNMKNPNMISNSDAEDNFQRKTIHNNLHINGAKFPSPG